MTPRTRHPNHLFLLQFLLVTTVLSQRTPKPRYEALSTTSPITKALTATDTAAAKTLIQLIDSISTLIDARIDNKDPEACNLRASPWIKLQLHNFETRNLGDLQRTCQSSLTTSHATSRHDIPQSFFHDAREALRVGTTALSAAAASYVQISHMPWTAVYPVRGWEIYQNAQTCTLESATAFRVNGVWYTRAVVTNHRADAFQANWERLYVEEFIHPELGQALHTLHPDASGERINATTLLISRGGKAAISTVPMGYAENPALVEALRLNELAVDQAVDAVTPSNIAILALPMVMALIPVAFVADLNTCATMLYIVFTDIFSSLPFLIKGIELTATGVVNRGELVAYHLGTTELGVLEIWAAECHGKDSFRNVGIAFVLIAACVMVLGILFEYFAWKWMKQNGRLGKSPYGHVFVMNRYTVFEKTVDDDDGEEIITQGKRSWRIHWTGTGRHRKLDESDDEYD